MRAVTPSVRIAKRAIDIAIAGLAVCLGQWSVAVPGSLSRSLPAGMRQLNARNCTLSLNEPRDASKRLA